MGSILSYLVSISNFAMQVGAWANAHPSAAAFWGTLAAEAVVKYSPLFADKGLIEEAFGILRDAIRAAMSRSQPPQ